MAMKETHRKHACDLSDVDFEVFRSEDDGMHATLVDVEEDPWHEEKRGNPAAAKRRSSRAR